jgi:hypothetical protein
MPILRRYAAPSARASGESGIFHKDAQRSLFSIYPFGLTSRATRDITGNHRPAW